MINKLVWFSFMAYQPLWVIEWKIRFYTHKQLYFLELSLLLEHFYLHTFKCQDISISNKSVYYKYAVSMSKTVLFQTSQFSMITQFSSTETIDRTLSDSNTHGKSGPGSDGNNGVLRIPQHYWSLTIRLFVSYQDTGGGGGGSYSFAGKHSVYSSAPVDSCYWN